MEVVSVGFLQCSVTVCALFLVQSLEELKVYNSHLSTGDLRASSLRTVHPRKLVGILRHLYHFSPFAHLFKPLFMSLWTRGYLFYSLDFNLILLYLFCSNVSNFCHWTLFQLASGFLWYNPIKAAFTLFFSFFLFKITSLWLRKVSLSF